MKRFLAVSAVSAAFLMSAAAHADDVLTGDAKLACEATLCLSSGDRPSECNESIRRYFSIKHKRPHKTLQARKDFLNLCPSSKEDGMPQLVDALANGAGRCDAAELNRVMTRTYIKKVRKHRSNKAGGSYTVEVPVRYVRNAKPGYCQAYFDHEWTTAGDKVQFVGVEKEGGRWVDVK
ncbi:TrbM/KikA/MpfK family conjugal transfer protein [Neisseria dentiae]|uniref:TrbM/KikA/MpfK family conjugal transfer protein n=1 Tax=Neisseria dentiae TaxID=194197 RepID=UPI0035A17310